MKSKYFQGFIAELALCSFFIILPISYFWAHDLNKFVAYIKKGVPSDNLIYFFMVLALGLSLSVLLKNKTYIFGREQNSKLLTSFFIYSLGFFRGLFDFCGSVFLIAAYLFFKEYYYGLSILFLVYGIIIIYIASKTAQLSTYAQRDSLNTRCSILS